MIYPKTNPDTQGNVRNNILKNLPTQEIEEIFPRISRIWLPANSKIVSLSEPSSYVYFPESAVVAVIACGGHRRRCYTGLYGFEGFGNASLALDVPTTPSDEAVLAAGYVFRLQVESLRDLLSRLPEFRRRMHRYVHIFMMQISYTALANASTRIEQRLARWLLMYQDRARTRSLTITHARLAEMLGVRRSGITQALHVLEGESLIRGHRGLIDILDRPRLVLRTAGSYGAPEAEYLRLF